MPDDSNKVWVDATFIPSKTALKDVPVNVQLADDENIGSYSMPVIYTQEEADLAAIDTWVQYFHEITSISGVANVPGEYRAEKVLQTDGVYISLVEFLAGQKDLLGDEDTTVLYTTGYNSVSGTLNERIVFTAGRKLPAVDNVPTYYRTNASISGTMEWWVNYTNFSGNLTTSGTPIPFHYGERSYQAEYGAEYTSTSGYLDKIVEINFAGWVDFLLYADVYSADLGFKKGYDGEVTVISGSVDPIYLDLVSSLLTTSGVGTDIYCALMDYTYIPAEAETIKGRISYLECNVYSTIKEETAVRMDVDLLSLKISNFSLDEGEFTTASGFISVDVTDDECPVSTSGTYFMMDGNQIPVTFSGIDDGYRMYYDPLDDFSSIEGPTTFTVHAENECDKILERDYYLTFGYIVEYKNYPGQGLDYGYDNKVAVRVTAENYASCPQVSSLAWDFDSIELKDKDLGASIIGRFHAWENEDLQAQIYPHSTAYFYGKEFRVVVKAKDFAGNKMEPFVLSYKIENKPEN